MPHLFERMPSRLLRRLLFAALVLSSGTALAQGDGSFEESEVQTVGEQQEEAPRDSVREQLEGAPRADARWFEETIDLAQVERMDTAMNRLRELVEGASQGSEQRANYMFRLAELYYTKARFFEQRAYDRRDRAFEVRNENPAQAAQYELAADDDLEQSDVYATEAVELYVELYASYRDTYPDMDAVLYYLGSTLSQLGRTEDALDFFEELANDFPSSAYLPRALLAFGEYYFQLGDMEEAQLYYQAVTEFPEASIYPYALYQEAWCFFNTEDYPEALQRLIDSVNASVGDSAGQIQMRRRALRDLAIFFVEVGTASDAFAFFEAIAPDQSLELVSLVASIFSEDGNYAAANSLFRELMSRNPDSFQIVGYQEEIVRNTLPSEDQEEIVREVRRLVELFQAARSFSDAEATAVTEAGARIEYQVRQLATTYHREAQVLNNERMYALAYNLYGDYVGNLAGMGEPATRYTMAYYYGELLYRNERFEDAAHTWELCLEMDPAGAYTEQATYKAVLAYTRLVDMNAVQPPDTPPQHEPDAEVPIPEPQPLPVVMEELIEAATRYLTLNPADEFAVEVEYVAAWVLYEYSHLDEAIERFGHIAMNYASVDAERARVSAELLLDALGALRRFGEMETWIDRLRSTPLANGPFGARLDELGQQITFSRCRTIQSDGRHEDAGLCFFEFVRSYPDSDLVDGALYNAAFSFEEEGMLSRGIRCRELLLQLRPDSELAEETRYSLAQDFHRLALYRDAAQHYEDFASDFPESEHAMTALASGALFRKGLGEYEQAVADYETFIDIFDDRERIAEAVFQIGAVHEEQGQYREARQLYERYLDRYASRGTPGRAVEAASAMGRLLWDERPDRAEPHFMDALERYNDMSDDDRAALQPSALDAAAEARFMLGEGVFGRFSSIEIAGAEDQVQERLREKREIGLEASAVYEQVQAFRRPGWSIAAFTRLGQLYHNFYEGIVNAPVPDGMSWEIEEQYRAMLEEQATEVRFMAIDHYNTALQIARTAGWFNEYSSLAETNLAALDPSFRAGTEVRAQPVHEPFSFHPAEFIGSEDGDEDDVDDPPATTPTEAAGEQATAPGE